MYTFIAIVLSAYYWLLMRRYGKNWEALPEWHIPADFIAHTKVTILVPARNESANIEICLQSILQQNYPANLWEVIVIDDHSTDDTAAIVSDFAKTFPAVKLLRLSDFPLKENDQAYKKRAIELGIQQASGTLILTTDADCQVPENWLPLMVSFYEKKQPVFIAAPVNFYQEKSLLERFQSLDFIGMMGITGAGIHGKFQHMCNGANLAYEKTAFMEVGGFKGITGKASGDDMLLLQKMYRRFPHRIGFLKNTKATVLTPAMPTLKQFLQQRIRWASKSGDYPEWQVTFRLAMVFFLCWSILLSLFLIPFWGTSALIIFTLQLVSKSLADYFFLQKMSSYFGRSDLMKTFLPSAIYHLLYIATVGLLANLTKEYEWKGRRVR